MITRTPYLSFKKLDHRDTDYPDWGTPQNDNMNITDLAFGDLQYTEENYVTDSTPPAPPTPISVVESQSVSLDNLDMQLMDIASSMPTTDQKLALVGEGTPATGNKYATKSYVDIARKLVLFPECGGSTLTNIYSGGNENGNMTATKEASGNYAYNHYKWLSCVDTAWEIYSILIQWKVPETFVSFLATANKALIVDIKTEEAADTSNKIDVVLQKDGVATTSSITGKFSTVAATWYSEKESNELIGFDATDAVLASLSPGNTLNIVIKMYSKLKYCKVGAVTIQFTGQ